jgi:hypothetical protein
MNETPQGTTAPNTNVTLRFGPGVPPGVAEVWHGTPAKPRNQLARRIGSAVATLAIALTSGAVVWYLLHSGGPQVRVTSVTVTAPAKRLACDSTARVVGVIRTNGGKGSISYRWRRSDGQISPVFTDRTGKGQHSIRVPLRWTVKGPGNLHAVATLEITRPTGGASTASAAFEYSCE